MYNALINAVLVAALCVQSFYFLKHRKQAIAGNRENPRTENEVSDNKIGNQNTITQAQQIVNNNYAHGPEFKTEMERHLHETVQQLLQNFMQKDRELAAVKDELHRLKLENASKVLPLYELRPKAPEMKEVKEPRRGGVSIYPRQSVAV